MHALRVKGFAKLDVLCEITALAEADVAQHLKELAGDELTLFREARGLWQLTPGGREVHRELLAEDLAAAGGEIEAVKVTYPRFLELNEQFKALCGEWQLRDGNPNDHSDTSYDEAVIGRLITLDSHAWPVCEAFGAAFTRLAPYAPRLGETAKKVRAGEHKLFTGVMCSSYHDVWMELHEDLIVTLGIDRVAEGSF